VVVSLIYLAGRIRQNSRLLKASTAAMMGEADIAINSVLLGDSELMRVFVDGMIDPARLSSAEFNRFGVAMGTMMRAFHRSFALARGSGIDDSLWETELRSYSYVVQSAGGQRWWIAYRNIFSDAFARFIDGLIREAEVAR
jgi:hypothetical protein